MRRLLKWLGALCLVKSSLMATTCGKVDAGPAYLHIDVLESGKTIKKIDLPGARVDAAYLVWKGICIKPNVLYGGKGNNQIVAASFGVGHYTPLNKQFALTPVIGGTYTYFKTTLAIPFMPDMVVHLKERFHSLSLYLGLEVCYTFYKGWRAIACYQYAWSHSHTQIKGVGTTKSNPKGSNISLMVEWDVNRRWSVNIAAGYNESLTREKHGLRGYGTKLGFTFWF